MLQLGVLTIRSIRPHACALTVRLDSESCQYGTKRNDGGLGGDHDAELSEQRVRIDKRESSASERLLCV